MTDTFFRIQSDKMIQLFKECELYKDSLSYNKPRIVKNHKIKCSADYSQYYQEIINKTDYDIILNDDSIIQVNRIITSGVISYRYMYMQPAYHMIPFDIYQQAYGSCEETDMMDYIRECYEVEGKVKNEFPCYVRYDADAKGYKKLVHSYAHIHLGFNNPIRIPVSTIWTPTMFASFIIRQFYVENWEKWLYKDLGISKLEIKKRCEKIEDTYWNCDEERDAYIK